MSEPLHGGTPGRALGRLAVQFLGMVGVAICTNWALDGRAREEADRADALRDQVEAARFERDRMSRLNHELARELNEAAIAAEVARWQLRYTEERLRRTEAESQLVTPVVAEHTEPRSGSLPARGSVEPLDAAAEAFLAAQVRHLAEGGSETRVTLQEEPQADSTEGSSTDLELDALDWVEIAELAPATLGGRSAALSEWRSVLSETLAAECGSRSGARAHACRTELERRLFPYSERAVRCLLSGNAEPDYVPVSAVERLPTHSVPLKRGALILCDGALEHL